MTFTGTMSTDADRVQLFSVYPTKPIGDAVLNSGAGTWSLTTKFDLLEHGSYTFVAEVSRGASSAQASRAFAVSAVADPGTWSSGAYFDTAFLAENASAAAGALSPLEGTGTLSWTNSPPVATGSDYRKVVELLAANSQDATITTSFANGTTRPSLTVVLRVLATAGSNRLFGFANSATAIDYIEGLLSSGKVVQATARAGAAGGTAISTVSFGSDMDVPSLTAHTLVFSIDGVANTMSLFFDGGADAQNPRPFDPGAFAYLLNRVVIGARGTSAKGGPFTGQIRIFGWRLGTTNLSGAQTIHNHIVANGQSAPVGPRIMVIGHSLARGDSSFGGIRKALVDRYAANSLTLSHVGPYNNGGFANNAHNGQGGNNLAAIQSQNNPFITTYAPKRLIGIVWANDVDEVGISSSTLMTRYSNWVTDAWTKGVAADAGFKMILSETAEPYDPAQSASAAARITELNAGLISTFHDSFNSSHPGAIIRGWDLYNSIGGWNSTSYATDRVHPLGGANGYYKWVDAATIGLWAIVASDFAAL